MFLLDTNIISETSRSNPDKSVLMWLNDHVGHFVSVLSVQEINFGIEQSQSAKKKILQEWWLNVCQDDTFTFLIFDNECAQIAGKLMASTRKNGINVPILDLQIAATSLRYKLTLATRNEKDLIPLSIPLVNPFKYLG